MLLHACLFAPNIINSCWWFLQFKHHISSHYQLLCHLLALELKYEVRALVRRVFIRIGQEFDIIGHDEDAR